MSTVADLWALQTTDLAVEAIRQRLAELEKQLGESADLKAARAAAAEAQAELERCRAGQQQLDQQVKSLATQIRAAERDLLSGRVRNPRELESMEANVIALRRRHSALEADALALMLEVDRWEAEAAARQSRQAGAEAAQLARQGAIKREAGQRLAELKVLSTRFSQQWEATAPQDRNVYKNLRSRKGGKAVAREQGGACQACGLMLPTGAVQAVHVGDQRVYCPGCGRLLLAG
jgi:predicted  nucleic acid-binding Zn-ribbon protein